MQPTPSTPDNRRDRESNDVREQELLRLADAAYLSLMQAAGVLSEMTEKLREMLGRVERGEAEFDEELIQRIEHIHQEFGPLIDDEETQP